MSSTAAAGAPALRKNSRTTISAPADAYAPGRLRGETDAERHAVRCFRGRHPEFDGLADEALAQAMNLRQRQGRQAAELRFELDVAEDWQDRRAEDCSPHLAEEM